MTADEARRLALALPNAVEQDHHGRPSFRVGGKIFATIWDERTMNVMVRAGDLHRGRRAPGLVPRALLGQATGRGGGRPVASAQARVA